MNDDRAILQLRKEVFDALAAVSILVWGAFFEIYSREPSVGAAPVTIAIVFLFAWFSWKSVRARKALRGMP